MDDLFDNVYPIVYAYIDTSEKLYPLYEKNKNKYHFAEVVYAGTTVNAMSVKHKKYEFLDRASIEKDLNIIE